MELDLQRNLEDLEEFHQQDAYERIEKWYTSPEGQQEEATGWDSPPHVFSAERAAGLITYALEIWVGRDRRSGKGEYPPLADARDILLLVGVETLLTGIAMKEDTDWFINQCLKSGNTPSFGRILNDKVPQWIDGLSEEHQVRVVTVLRILKEHRKNLVHFGFHQMRHNPDLPAYYDVLAYLFAEYFGSDLPVVNELRERADRLRKIHHNVDYQWLYFEF